MSKHWQNLLTLVCGAGAYVAGGPGAQVVGSLLANSQLPQLQVVLEAEPLAAQLDAHALLRLLKAFLQARPDVPSRAAACHVLSIHPAGLLKAERLAPQLEVYTLLCIIEAKGALSGAWPVMSSQTALGCI